MMRFPLLSTVLVLSFLPFQAGTSLAVVPLYFESFETTIYKDPVNTTALWDTGTGELKLPPFVPSLTGSYDTPGVAGRVAVAGDLAFVADGTSGLRIIDIQNLASPALVGAYSAAVEASDVAVAGDLAFVADGISGLRILNISNPAAPTLVGTYNTSGFAYGVAVAGDLAFVADGSAGLRLVSILNPAAPTLVGTYNTPGNARGVAVAGDLAFVADDASGLQIISILNPAAPALVGTYDTPGTAFHVAVAGDLAFVADYASGLQIISILNPASPTLAGTYDTPGQTDGVAVAGDLAIVADQLAGIHLIDVTLPAAPTLAGSFDTEGSAFGVAVDGGHAFVADAAAGLQIIEIRTPALPRLVVSVGWPVFPTGVAVAGNHAFVTAGDDGLFIFDITDPGNPLLVGSYNTPGTAANVAVDGDLAFVADTFSMLILNVSDPASPTFVGSYSTPTGTFEVAIAGDLAVLAGGHLLTVNISNPASPTLVGDYDLTGFGGLEDVAVTGDLVVGASGIYGFKIFSISNPASPSFLDQYIDDDAYDVAVAGDLAFVAGGHDDLRILDISDPSNVALVGSYTAPAPGDYMRGVAVAGDFVFLANGRPSDLFGSLEVLDISNPASPALVGSCQPMGFSRGVAVDGNLVFVAGLSSFGVIEVFSHELHTLDNTGRSLNINPTADPVLAVRLSSLQAPDVSWELSVNGGFNWFPVANDYEWDLLSTPGSDLRWRSTHSVITFGVNPVVSEFVIGWLYEFAYPDTITDIPGDQGGWVRLHFVRSGRDFAEESSLPIAHYGVWRRVDSMALASALAGSPEPAASVDPLIASAYEGLPLFGRDGGVFVESAPGEPSAALPPGTWELVQTVPALQQDSYLTAIPTLGDSTESGITYTELVVTAHTTTPSIWYASPSVSGYSVDNIAPAVPSGFAVAYGAGSGNTLSWDPSPESDFQYFRVYRSTDPDFTPSPGTLVHSTTSTGWVDPDYDGGAIYYRITALDYAGNESDPAAPGTVTAVGDPTTPNVLALHPNAPNPFSSSTVIRYEVPERAGALALRIYDARGRVVKTLVDGPQTPGTHTIAWDGRDDAGRPVAPGVYVYQVSGADRLVTRKLVRTR